MPSTEHKFNNAAYSNLIAAISASATTAALVPGGVHAFLKGWESSKYMYLTLVDPAGNIEIVRVSAISGDNLIIARGQNGSVARAWPSGTLVTQRVVAANLTGMIQKEAHRSITVNPNGVYTASYPGEKVYQSGPTACERRWWKNTSGTKWRLIAGALCGNEYLDGDGYVVTPEILNPDSDVDVGLWAIGGGVNPASYTEIDEGVDSYSDADFIYADFPTVAEFGFEDYGAAVYLELNLRIRAYCANTVIGKLGIQFYTGAVPIGSQYVIGTDEPWQNADGDDTFHEYDIEWLGVSLSAAEADDLRIKLETTQFGVVVRVSVLDVTPL